MNSNCFITACDREVAFLCYCSSPPISLCKKHSSYHLIEEGEHNPFSLIFRPNAEKSNLILESAQKALANLSLIQKQLFKTTQKLIETIYQCHAKSLATISQLKAVAKSVLYKLKPESELNKEDVEQIRSITNFDVKMHENYKGLVKRLNLFYEIDLCHPDEDSKIFFFDTNFKSLSLVDLTINEVTLKPSANTFGKISEIIKGSSCCRINKNEYAYRGNFKINGRKQKYSFVSNVMGENSA
jgi:hypothetical protein